MEILASDFACYSIEDAEEALKKLQIEADAAKADFDKTMAEFQEKWKRPKQQNLRGSSKICRSNPELNPSEALTH
jgi:hypothetical protein